MSLVRLGALIDHEYLLTNVKRVGLRKIQKAFTIKTPGHNNTIKTISMYRLVKIDDTLSVVVPRFGGFMLQDINVIPKLENKLQMGESREFKTVNLKLTANQLITLEYLLKNVYSANNTIAGRGSTILQMEPGYGKTYLAMGLIRCLKKKTFIIVPNTYLLRQWTEALTIVFPDMKIGCYYGTKKVDGDIIVSIINSAIKYNHYNKCGLIIYDEVHMYCSNKFSKIFNTAQSNLTIGLTATPCERIDKFDPVAQWSLGKVIYADKIEGWNPADVKFTSEVTNVSYSGPKEYTKIMEASNGIVSVPLMINQIQGDPYRNRLIVAYASQLYLEGKNVFVFSDRREHLHTLAAMLKILKISAEVPEDDTDDANIEGVKELMGGSTEVDIEEAKSSGRIIMTTYQYSGTGVSINKMNALILATPRRSNMKQILGRIFRLKGDSEIKRRIIDIVDVRICLKAQFSTRKKIYISEMQAPILVQKINWDVCTSIQDIQKII